MGHDDEQSVADGSTSVLQVGFVAEVATATAQAASGPAQASSEQTAPGSVIVQANSVSHAKEYAQFMRARKNKKRFSADLKGGTTTLTRLTCSTSGSSVART